MAKLVLQIDLRLRRLEDEGLVDCVATFAHYDLPPEAAGGYWSTGGQVAHEAKAWEWFVNHISQELPGLLDHCQYEQAELPFP